MIADLCVARLCIHRSHCFVVYIRRRAMFDSATTKRRIRRRSCDACRVRRASRAMPRGREAGKTARAPPAKRARGITGGVAPPPPQQQQPRNPGADAHESNASGDDDDDDEAAGRHAPNGDRAQTVNAHTDGALLRPKASPLSAEDIPLLNVAERRAVLSRWNSRLRALKNRARDISYQFPTANVSVFLSKPFPTERRHRWWYVAFFLVLRFVETRSRSTDERLLSLENLHRAEEEFLALGPMTRVAREYREDDETKLLSGAQILRRTFADVTDVTMNEKEKRVDALESNGDGDVVAARRGGDVVDASHAAREDTSAKTVDGLFRRLMPLVPVELHARLAHDLVTSGFVLRAGGAPGGALLKKFKDYEAEKKARSATQRGEEAGGSEDMPRTEEERRLIGATLRAHRQMNATDVQ